MGHLKRRSLSPQQGGFTRTFRGEAEVTGNYLERRALDKDDIDAAQSTVFIDKLDGEVFSGASPLVKFRSLSTDFTTEGGGIAPGDFLSVEGIDGYFQLTGATESNGGADNTVIIDTFPILVNETTGAIASNVLTDASVSDFLNLGAGLIDTEVRVGDRVEIFSDLNIRQVFLVLAVASGFVTLDGVPVDDSGFTYRITRPPRLAEFPLSEDGQTGLRFRIAKGLAQEQGAPPLTRYPGFGDAMLSRNFNRGLRALSQNTQYLKAVTDTPFAVARRFETPTHAGSLDVDITAQIGTAGVWTGKAGTVIGIGNAQIAQFLRVYGIDGLDIEVGGVTVKVDDIQDGATNSLLGRGFVLPVDVGGTIKMIFNLTIPTANSFVVTFGDGKSLEDIVADEPDAFMKGEFVLVGVDDEVIPELVASRDSTRFGTHATLLARLQNFESRHQDWFWNGEVPNIQVVEDTTAGGGFTLHFGVTQIDFNNVTYELTTDATDALASSGIGFIKATLSGGGSPPGTLVLVAVPGANFDRTTLASADGDTGATEFIVGTYDTSDQSVRLLHVAEDAPQRRANELLGDGVIEGVTDDYETREAPAPDATARIFSGLARIGGHEVKNNVGAPGFTLTPAAFAGPNSRIDLTTLSKTGKLDLVTGVESGSPVIPDLPADTIELSQLFLRRTAGGAGPPLTVDNENDGANSFVHLNPQRFLVQADGTQVNHHPANHVRNGGFLTNPAGEWTPNSGTITQSAAQVKFGDNSGLFAPAAGAGSKFTEQTVDDIKPFLGRYATLSFYVRLVTVNSAPARLSLIVTGGTDLVATATANDELWQRIHVSGFIPADATVLVIRLEGDTADANTTQVYFDGVQLSVGKILTEFEYPPPVVVGGGGGVPLPFESTPDSIITGGLVTDAVAVNTVDITAGQAVIVGQLVSWGSLSLTGFGGTTTNFISVNSVGTVSTSTSQPTGDALFLATVVTNGVPDIASVDDRRIFLAEGESSVTGCRLVRNTVTLLSIEPGKLLVNGEIRVNPTTIDIDLSSAVARQAGQSELNNTWYYIYGADSDNAGVFVNKPGANFFFSTTVPTDLGRHPLFGWKYIGAVRNDSGFNLIQFWQRGAHFTRNQTILVSEFTTTVTTTLDSLVPLSANTGKFVMRTKTINTTGAGIQVGFQNPDDISIQGFWNAVAHPISRGHIVEMDFPLSDAQQLRTTINNTDANYSVWLRGWIDNLIATEAK